MDLMVAVSCRLTLQICLIIALSFRCRRKRQDFVTGQISRVKDWVSVDCGTNSFIVSDQKVWLNATLVEKNKQQKRNST